MKIVYQNKKGIASAIFPTKYDMSGYEKAFVISGSRAEILIDFVYELGRPPQTEGGIRTP